jgi:hypothetical protein
MRSGRQRVIVGRYPMKGLVSGLIIAAFGFLLMAFTYFNYQYDPGSGPWKDAVMYLGKGQPDSEAGEFEYVTRPVRLLHIPRRAESFVPLARSFSPEVEKSYCVSFQEKVFLYSGLAADFTSQMLESGRLPAPGADEAVAGFNAGNQSEVTVFGRTFEVVGRFKSNVRLFVDSYLIDNDGTARELFNPDDEAVRNAYILRLTRNQLNDRQVREHLAEEFPKTKFSLYDPQIRTRPGAFYIYIAGMALLLFGGFTALYKLYCLLAEKIGNKWLRLPLAEIRKYRCLFIALHVICFGTVILLMLVAYQLPELQSALLAGTQFELAEGSGHLNVAYKAYMTRNIPLAAVTTFVINFIIGSLAFITLPSVIIPGAGVLVIGIRTLLWGLLMAPSFVSLSGAMLPHSFTMLLEGEAYIVAGFFGLLVPVYLLRKAEGPGLVNRYGRALLMNVRGNLLVAIILAIAAIYEAIEVILMME